MCPDSVAPTRIEQVRNCGRPCDTETPSILLAVRNDPAFSSGMRLLLRCLAACWLARSAAISFASATDLAAKIDEVVGREMTRQKIPEVAVALFQTGEVVPALFS